MKVLLLSATLSKLYSPKIQNLLKKSVESITVSTVTLRKLVCVYVFASVYVCVCTHIGL